MNKSDKKSSLSVPRVSKSKLKMSMPNGTVIPVKEQQGKYLFHFLYHYKNLI